MVLCLRPFLLSLPQCSVVLWRMGGRECSREHGLALDLRAPVCVLLQFSLLTCGCAPQPAETLWLENEKTLADYPSLAGERALA